MLRIGQTHQARPNERAKSEVEGMNQFLLKEPVGGAFSLGNRKLAQVVECQWHCQARSNDLHGPTVNGGKGGAQNFVASHDFIDAPLQNGHVDRRRQAKRIEDIEKRHARQRVLQLPQSLLSGRCRHLHLREARAK